MADYISQIAKKLKETGFAEEPGAILYSGNETLVEGDFYFLGDNPGGNTNLSVANDTVMNQLLRKDETFNEYFQGIWKKSNQPPSPPGGATLQLRIKILFSRLGINLRKTCSSNLNFVRSPVLSELHLNEKMTQEKCWEIHQIILSIVKPKIVFVFGDGARDFIISKMKIIEESEPYSLPSRKKEYIFRSVRGTVQVDGSSSEHKICLLSMPHLSRFKIDARGDETNSAYDARTAIDWMNEEKNRYLS